MLEKVQLLNTSRKTLSRKMLRKPSWISNLKLPKKKNSLSLDLIEIMVGFQTTLISIGRRGRRKSVSENMMRRCSSTHLVQDLCPMTSASRLLKNLKKLKLRLIFSWRSAPLWLTQARWNVIRRHSFLNLLD